MTATEYRAQNAPNLPRMPSPASPKGKTQPAEREDAEKPAFEIAPATPCTYLLGAYALAVGGRLHAEQLPGRLRLVVTGPASAALTAHLVAALKEFTNQP